MRPQIKNGKHRCLMQYLIRQSFKGYCWDTEYMFSFLNLLVWLSPMQCYVKCRLPEEGNSSRCNIKRVLPMSAPSIKGGRGAAPPPLVPPCICSVDL